MNITPMCKAVFLDNKRKYLLISLTKEQSIALANFNRRDLTYDQHPVEKMLVASAEAIPQIPATTLHVLLTINWSKQRYVHIPSRLLFPVYPREGTIRYICVTEHQHSDWNEHKSLESALKLLGNPDYFTIVRYHDIKNSKVPKEN